MDKREVENHARVLVKLLAHNLQEHTQNKQKDVKMKVFEQININTWLQLINKHHITHYNDNIMIVDLLHPGIDTLIPNQLSSPQIKGSEVVVYTKRYNCRVF